MEALRIARAKSAVPPLQQRVQSCKLYIERAKQRGPSRGSDHRAVEQKAICEGEVAEGEKRRQQLMTEDASPAPPAFDEGARDVESREEAGGLVLGWTSIYERDPANSRQCARVGTLDKRDELRFEERFGIWGHQHSCPDRFIVEPRHLPARVSLKAVPFFDDGVSHPRVRCEKKVGPKGNRDASRGAIDAREPRVNARYGLRGARVGEASKRELTSFDTSDDEPMVRPLGSRNVVPRVASASFPGQSRHLRRLPASSRSIAPTSSTVPAASGELQLLERGRVVDAVPVMDMSVNDSYLELPLEGNRFAAFVDRDAGLAAQGAPSAETVRQRRRLVLVFDPLAEGEVCGQESEADTESLTGVASEVETVEVLEPTIDSDPIPTERPLRAPGAFASLDAVDLHEFFELRARVMRSVPVVLRGAFRAAIRVSTQEILNGVERTAKSELREAGSYSCCCPGCFCFDQSGAAWFPARSWKVASHNSKKGIGSLS